MQANSSDSAIISDTSCLIALTKINRLEILQKLYKEIIVTTEIATEYQKPLPEWIIKRDVQDKKLIAEIQRKGLDIGESSVIALAMETKNPLLILDDNAARKFALKMGLAITGTLGVISRACDYGFIESYEDACNDLRKIDNFRFSKKIQDEAKNKPLAEKALSKDEKNAKHQKHSTRR